MRDPHGNTTRMNVHGAGAQRSDPKSGNPADYEGGFGPQGDEIRIYNYVRCVRTATSIEKQTQPEPTHPPETKTTEKHPQPPQSPAVSPVSEQAPLKTPGLIVIAGIAIGVLVYILKKY